jgi:hypothetical protein
MLNVGCFFALMISCVTIFAQPTEIQMLSGHGKDDAVPWKFLCTSGAHSGYWTNLPVPSNWELHGFGTINYHRDLTNAYDERGLYEHDFSVPAAWAGKRIFLVFDGSMTDTSAKLNGQPVGPMHQGAYYRFKYDVTSLVNFGTTNKLEVTVAKHSANASVNGAERTGDYWMYGGIFRPVFLEAVPLQFIARVAVDAPANGHFSMDVFLDGVTNADEVEAQIQTLEGKNVGPAFSVKLDRKSSVQLETQIPSPRLWTAETPNLYKVEVCLKERGRVIHQIEQRFGFRTLEVRDGDGLYLNGKRIVLKGCNRHSFWPDSGRCLSEAVQRLDIETMKDMNMNAVRMSHYPPDAAFLDDCDRFGLYVLDELAGWHKAYDTDTGPQLVREMVTRDVNHPSILFWDNGNEGGFNTNLDHLFGDYDPQHRRVLHPWAPFDGLNTAHYLPYDFVRLAGAGVPITFHKNHYLADTNTAQKWIYLPTEFLHGLYDGGAGSGFADVWHLMSQSKYLGGGFFWAFLDEGVKRADNGQIDVAGNEAPDGIVGPYRQREASFYTIKEIWSPIQVIKGENFSFAVENHFSFTDTKACKFSWEWRRFPRPDETNSGYSVVNAGVFKSPAIPPGGTGRLEFKKIPPVVADALALRVDDPTGRELWTWVWPLHPHQDYLGGLMTKAAPALATAVETNNLIEVRAGNLTVTFSRQSGLLAGVQRGTQVFSLTNGPYFTGGNGALTNLELTQDGLDCVVSEKFAGGLRSVVWRVNGNGWLGCHYTYAAEGPQDYLGLQFAYPENLVKSKRWLGDGPYRVWKNRTLGVTFGVWQNDYNDTITGWRDWIYPEFKGCFANVRWLQLRTDEGLITVVPENVPFVQVLTPAFPPVKLAGNTIPPLPACGLAFLNIIPPMGSKFQKAEDVSPSGEHTVAHGEYTGVLNFYFGPLP